MCLKGLQTLRKWSLILQVVSVVTSQTVVSLSHETNLALNHPVYASSTCGTNGKAEEFCKNGEQCLEEVDICNTTCGNSAKVRSYIDVLAAGQLNGQVCYRKIY